MFLKQSTSAVVLVGPVLDASGVAVTTAVIGDFTLSKNGTSAAMSGNTISHSHNGHYAITLTATNTDTIGRLTISVNNTAQAMPVFRWDICQPTVYDALFTNAVNTTGGLPAATGAISALAGAVSTLTAAGVRTELATELGRIDTTISSRLAAVSYVAPDNATIGSISTNLATVNDNVLSRLAASAYTAPPSASTNATAVRSELTTELGRIDAAVTSRAAASDMSTLLARLGAFTGSGVNTVLGFLKAIASKAASTPSDIGGTFSATTDSVEAIRDAMQAGTGDASQATLVQVQGTVDAIAASLSGTAINVVSRVADGGDITLYAGDDMRVRSGTEVAVTISDVGGAIYTRLDSIGVAQLAFGAARPSQPAGAITGTIASLSQAGSGSSQTLTINIEIEDGGERLAPADNYVWQIVSSDAQGAEYDTYTEVEGMLTLKRRVAVPLYS